MEIKSLICLVLMALSLINLFGPYSCYANLSDHTDRRLKTVDPGEPVKSMAEELAQRVDLEMWPESNVWRVAPAIDDSSLLPGNNTDFSCDFSFLRFKSGNMGGVGRWRWDKLKEDQISSEKVLHGQIYIVICVAENSRAAYEFLIVERSKSTMPAEAIARDFSKPNRIEGLGTIGFSRHVYTMFVRDNIAVLVRVDGDWEQEPLALALEIDRLIKAKPILTYEQFQARRPVVSIAPEVDIQKTERGGVRWRRISYDASAPANRNIKNRVAYINGEHVGFHDGRISVPRDEKGLVTVELIVVTDELLVGKAERTIDLGKIGHKTEAFATDEAGAIFEKMVIKAADKMPPEKEDSQE